MNPDRLWLRFVWLALVCALLPGLGLATVMVSAWLVGFPLGVWYLAAIQTHATALLMGWGGAMILGVALHFLPRLRGVKLAHPSWVSALFWLLALGLTARVVGQPLLALVAPTGQHASVAWLNAAITGGVILQAVAIVGLLGVLLVTFRSGPPLKKNHGFTQIAPLLAVAAVALSTAQLAWCWAAIGGLMQHETLAFLSPAAQSVAVDLMLFGFVAAIGLAMSSRLFPLTFRMQLPHQRGLQLAAWSLAIGVILIVIGGLRPVSSAAGEVVAHGAALFQACGLLVGAFTVRIFHARKPVPAGAAPYHVWEDPAAVGVVSAYGWLVVAGGLLLLFPLRSAGVPIPAAWLQPNLARHAVGLGFMTQLIMSVGWKMLPGFRGGRPRGPRLLWTAVVLGNLAVLLRLLPALSSSGGGSGRSWSELLFPFAGLAGLAAILAFAIALQLSFRKPAVPVQN